MLNIQLSTISPKGWNVRRTLMNNNNKKSIASKEPWVTAQGNALAILVRLVPPIPELLCQWFSYTWSDGFKTNYRFTPGRFNCQIVEVLNISRNTVIGYIKLIKFTTIVLRNCLAFDTTAGYSSPWGRLGGAYKKKVTSSEITFLRCGRDSNPRPPAWQADILTSWTTAPVFKCFSHEWIERAPFSKALQIYTFFSFLQTDHSKK